MLEVKEVNQFMAVVVIFCVMCLCHAPVGSTVLF